ncbi:MAG: barstar family protein [Phycisphaerales bacterium]|nr:barstar family protein [Hyphomonadaceae bacterium]
MKTIDVDCRGVRTEAAFWQRYVDVVKPAGADVFGRNLDALWDALDGGPGYPGPVVVRFTNTDELRSAENHRFMAALVKLAEDATGAKIIVR